MTFSEAVSNGFSNFFNATGRASRSEFWWWYLFCFIVSVGIGIVFGSAMNDNSFLSAIGSIIDIILCISVICAAIRRLHDIGKSGWNYCWVFLPLIGIIYLIVLWCQDSEPADNQYGANPNYIKE